MSELYDEGEERRQAAPLEPPRRSRALILTAVILVLGFFALTTFAAFWTDRAWYRSIGFGSVFSTLLWTRVGLFAAFGVLMAGFAGLNMYLAHRFRPLYRMSSPEQAGLDRYREVVDPIRTWLVVGVAGLLGLFAGTSASGQWRNYLLWRNGVPFGETDPYFDRDKGFYIFDLPWLHYLVDSAMAFTVVAALMAAIVHYLYGGIQLQTKADRLSGAAQVQLSVLLGVFVLAKAADYWLDRFDLVNDSGGLITGMTYTGENAELPAKGILMGIALICALLFFLNVWRRTWLLPSVGLGLLALSAVLLGMIWPGVVQQFSVNPSEPDKERPVPQGQHRGHSRGLRPRGHRRSSRSAASRRRRSTSSRHCEQQTSSVPLVDPLVVNRTFEQVQQVRAYYSVAPVLDVDRYEIDGDDRALVLGVRELDQAGINEADQNWNNLHTVYTHGSGMIAAYANQRGEDDGDESTEIQWAEGQQAGEDALTDLDPEGYEDRVYFGELSPDYSVVGKNGEDAADVELDLGSRPRATRRDRPRRTTVRAACRSATSSRS